VKKNAIQGNDDFFLLASIVKFNYITRIKN